MERPRPIPSRKNHIVVKQLLRKVILLRKDEGQPCFSTVMNGLDDAIKDEDTRAVLRFVLEMGQLELGLLAIAASTEIRRCMEEPVEGPPPLQFSPN